MRAVKSEDLFIMHFLCQSIGYLVNHIDAEQDLTIGSACCGRPVMIFPTGMLVICKHGVNDLGICQRCQIPRSACSINAQSFAERPLINE